MVTLLYTLVDPAQIPFRGKTVVDFSGNHSGMTVAGLSRQSVDPPFTKSSGSATITTLLLYMVRLPQVTLA